MIQNIQAMRGVALLMVFLIHVRITGPKIDAPAEPSGYELFSEPQVDASPKLPTTLIILYPAGLSAIHTDISPLNPILQKEYLMNLLFNLEDPGGAGGRGNGLRQLC
jgi:hypothetical protein